MEQSHLQFRLLSSPPAPFPIGRAAVDRSCLPLSTQLIAGQLPDYWTHYLLSSPIWLYNALVMRIDSLDLASFPPRPSTVSRVFDGTIDYKTPVLDNQVAKIKLVKNSTRRTKESN